MTVLHPGSVEAPLVVLYEPLSLWGGFEIESGRIIDRSHPQLGHVLTGQIVFMPHGRGSSSSSSVLAEAIRLDTAPAGLVLDEPDHILVIGAIVASRLYGKRLPIVVAAMPESAEGLWRLDENGLKPVDASTEVM